MIVTRRKSGAAVVWLAAGIMLAAAAAAETQIPKTDFYGTWAMSHDGWPGKLVLRASGKAKELKGDYVGADGLIRSARGTVESHKVVLTLDLKGTSSESDDQVFDGYLFTQGRAAMAGTTRYAGVVYGWYAVKESGETQLPPPPVVATDHPDPSGPEDDPVVVSSSGEIKLTVTKDKWTLGEKVVFEFKNTKPQTADLTDSYYIIERREGNKGKEFFTSDKSPFDDLELGQNEVRTWKWDQRDNERTHKAQPGLWHIKLHAPGIRPQPFVVTFRIVPPEG
ncbi:MAG: hypothetical protein JW747_10080 [Candidatus Aminicenantes bacterium]|nr:hypothetical protein [Candidatus Aminicenantes bacterium]